MDKFTNKIIRGDALTKLKELHDKSINMCMTSPPYWALRDYGTDVETIWDGDENCEHDFDLKEIQTGTQHWNQGGKVIPYKERKIHDGRLEKVGFCSKCGAWKGQLGLEPTFDLYISHLCDIFDEVKRVLRDDGTCWVNLGDSYYGSGGISGQKEGTKNLGYDTHKMGAVSQNELSKEWQRPSRKAFNEAGINKKCLFCGGNIKTGNNGQFCSRKCLNKMGNDFRSQNRLLPQKCLVGIPARFQIEMINRGWILRNTIVWHKPNCMPSSVKDRFTVDFEYVFFFVKKKKYYFETQYENFVNNSDVEYRKKLRVGKRYDLKKPYETNTPYAVQKRDKDFVEYRNFPDIKEFANYINSARKDRRISIEEIESGLDSQAPHHWFSAESFPSVDDYRWLKDYICFGDKYDKQMTEIFTKSSEKTFSEKGRNKRTVWSICPKPFKGAHFAVYPEQLVETPIKAGCPEFVCMRCEKAREKVFKGKSSAAFNIRVRDVKKERIKHTDRKASSKEVQDYEERTYGGKGKKFISYTNCGCDAGFKPGIVLDPFAGSGTTLAVAKKLGRNYIGIDLNPSYIKMAKKRIDSCSTFRKAKKRKEK